MICQFCGYEFEDACGKYGCPNCLGEALEESEMKALIIWVIIITAGIELGGMAFDKLHESVEADYIELQQNVEKLKGEVG